MRDIGSSYKREIKKQLRAQLSFKLIVINRLLRTENHCMAQEIFIITPYPSHMIEIICYVSKVLSLWPRFLSCSSSPGTVALSLKSSLKAVYFSPLELSSHLCLRGAPFFSPLHKTWLLCLKACYCWECFFSCTSFFWWFTKKKVILRIISWWRKI